MPTMIDLGILAFFSIGFLAWEHFVAWPRTVAAITSGRPGARIRAYGWIMLAQWAFTALVIVRLTRLSEPITVLGLTLPAGWRLALALLLIVATALLFVSQARSIARISDERMVALRGRLAPAIGDAIHIVPRTARERSWFTALAITAGICEEFLFRGYAVWVLRPWLGLWGAALVSVLLFGLGHSYQGRRGAVRATMVGAVLAILVLITGSIIPAMIVHAIVDIGSGAASYALLGEHRPQAAAASAA